MDTQKATTVDEYIETCPTVAQEKLRALRRLVQEAAPQAQEKLSYGMPYYSLNGRLLYFGAFKDHVSLFAMPSAIVEFAPELAKYQTSKGTIRFPLDEPLPTALISKIVRFRAEQNQAKNKK